MDPVPTPKSRATLGGVLVFDGNTTRYWSAYSYELVQLVVPQLARHMPWVQRNRKAEGDNNLPRVQAKVNLHTSGLWPLRDTPERKERRDQPHTAAKRGHKENRCHV